MGKIEKMPDGGKWCPICEKVKRAVMADVRARPRPVGKKVDRLESLLEAARRSARLSNWQIYFCIDLNHRLAERGKHLVLSPKQRESLDKIARRLGLDPL